MNRYFRTDLARELIGDVSRLPSGARFIEEISRGGFPVERLELDGEAGRFFSKPAGSYVTYACGGIPSLDAGELEAFSRDLSEELAVSARKMTGKNIDGSFKVLVAGLGNREMTPDAIGPVTVSKLNVTNHIAVCDPKLFGELGCCRLAAVAPGVLGQTGIETSGLVSAAVSEFSPDVVIAVDALAALSVGRLASTVQFSDAGIAPGAGIGNRRGTLNEKSLGVPVLAVGVPTVVDSSTLIADALERAGITGLSDPLKKVLETGKSYFVTPKDCDGVTEAVSSLLAAAIEKAFGIRRGDGA